MRFLVDESTGPAVARWLRSQGHEVFSLKIEVVGTTELTEPPFDWRPGGMTRMFGGGGRNWTQITTFCLHSVRVLTYWAHDYRYRRVAG